MARWRPLFVCASVMDCCEIILDAETGTPVTVSSRCSLHATLESDPALIQRVWLDSYRLSCINQWIADHNPNVQHTISFTSDSILVAVATPDAIFVNQMQAEIEDILRSVPPEIAAIHLPVSHSVALKVQAVEDVVDG